MQKQEIPLHFIKTFQARNWNENELTSFVLYELVSHSISVSHLSFIKHWVATLSQYV